MNVPPGGPEPARGHDKGVRPRVPAVSARHGSPPASSEPGAAAAGLRRLGQNAAALLLAYALPRVLTFGAVIIAARVLGAARFGAYGTAAALAVLLSITATLGMMPLLIREMARSPERAPRLLRTAHRVKTAANLFMLLLVFVLARWILDYPQPVVAAAVLLAVSYAIGAYVENFAAYFQAIERMGIWTQASAAYGLATGAAGTVIVLTTSSVVWFCVAPIIGQLAALGWLLARAPAALWRNEASPAGSGGRHGPGPGRAASSSAAKAADHASETAALLRALGPFAAAFIALTLYYKVDVLLLAHWRPAGEVGVYVAAYKFIDILHALTLVAAGAVYPRLSRSAPVAGQALALGPSATSGANGATAAVAAPGERWAGTRLTELGLVIAVPIAAVLWLLRAWAVHLLYGSDFAAATPVVGLLAVAVPPLVLNLLSGYVLGATGHMRAVAVGYAGAAVLNISLNAVLIPRWGAVGAGSAMVVSEIALAAFLAGMLRVHAAAAPGPRALAAACGAAALAGLTWLATTGLFGGGIAGGLAAGATTGAGTGALLGASVAYGAAVLVLYWRCGVLSSDEWQALRSALPRRARPPALRVAP